MSSDIVTKHAPGCSIFLVRFNNFDQTTGFYWSYATCSFLYKCCALVVRLSCQGQHGSCIAGMYRMRVGHEWLVRITIGLEQDFNWQCNMQPKIWWFERFKYSNNLSIKCIALFVGILPLCYLTAWEQGDLQHSVDETRECFTYTTHITMTEVHTYNGFHQSMYHLKLHIKHSI